MKDEHQKYRTMMVISIILHSASAILYAISSFFVGYSAYKILTTMKYEYLAMTIVSLIVYFIADVLYDVANDY